MAIRRLYINLNIFSFRPETHRERNLKVLILSSCGFGLSFEGEVRVTTKERSKPVIFHVKGPKHKPIFTLLSFHSSVYLILFALNIQDTPKNCAQSHCMWAKTNGTFKKLRGTQREYSSKSLKHSIVESILVFKR